MSQSNTVSWAEGAHEKLRRIRTACSNVFTGQTPIGAAKKGGYGIGLSAARAIAGANSGTISAKIEDGRILITVVLKKAPREQAVR